LLLFQMWICASTISMRCSLPFGPPAGAADVPGAGACACAKTERRRCLTPQGANST